MFFEWKDYCDKYEAEIESWMNDEDTRCFATDDIKDEHEYWSSESEPGEYFCKVILDGLEVIAIALIMRGDDRPIHLNPFIVNPKHRNKGYGTKIISEFIRDTSNIIGFNGDVFDVSIFPNNEAAIKMFEKAGYVMAGMDKDGECGYWVYPISELENYRTRCLADANDYFIATSTLPITTES